MCTSSLKQWWDFEFERILFLAKVMQILHILTASLKHAQIILKAAIGAGFRESGAINIARDDGGPSTPMVGVRCQGLALESIVGYLPDSGKMDQASPQSLVSEEHLAMLMMIANERFAENSKRTEDFRARLLQSYHSAVRMMKDPDPDDHFESRKNCPAWEGTKFHRDRKRSEGLAKQQAFHEQQRVKPLQSGNGHLSEEDDEMMSLGLDILA